MYNNVVPMEKTPSDHNMPSISILLFSIQFFLITLSWFQNIANFIPGFKSYVQSKLVFVTSSSRVEKSLNAKVVDKAVPHVDKAVPHVDKAVAHVNNRVDDDDRFRRDGVEMVMRNLGFFCSRDWEELPESFSFDEISSLFEESEPSLVEVKEAFDVFDENRDGFIDAKELQRVLCILGLKEGSELENCGKMIKNYDINGDGRIDFNEFVKFMETTFC